MAITREAVFSACESGRAACCLLLAEQWLADRPDDLGVISEYAEMLYRLGRYDEAIRVYLDAVDHFPGAGARGALFNSLGQLHRYRGDFAAAEAWFRRAIDAKPNHATGYIFLGAVQARQGKLKDAEGSHRRATQCTAGLIDEAHYNVGLVLRSQGRLAEAAQCFRMAIQIDPNYKVAIEALEDVESALALKPHPT